MRFEPMARVSTWRKLAVGMWGSPTSPTAQGQRELNLEKTLPWLEEAGGQAGQRLTVTHLAVAAVARALAANPEYNAILRRNRAWQRKAVDIFVQVAVPQGEGRADLSGLRIDAADGLTVLGIAERLSTGAGRIRGGDDARIEHAKKSLDRVPPVLAPLLMRAVACLNYDLGLDLSRLGIEADPFGSAMVTNVGGFGIRHALVPLLPTSRCPMIFCLGQIHDRVFAIDGVPSVRPAMIMTASFDHRLYDGFQIARMTNLVAAIVEDPAAHLF